jgi:outer membrane protein assembly factor BamB
MAADVDGDGREEILHGPWPLVCARASGEEAWRCDCGGVVAVADVDGDGETEVVVDGPRILSGGTGRVLWSRTGPGAVGRHRIHVGRFLPGARGLQIACVSENATTAGNHAQMWRFDEGCERAALAWETTFKRSFLDHCSSGAGPFDEDTLCVAAAVWSGIVALDPRDGRDLFRFYWQPRPGEGLTRNYGSLLLKDLDGDGKGEIVLLNDSICLQVGVFAPARDAGVRTSEAELYPSPPVAHGELASYAEGPILWRRYFGRWQPDGDYILRVPAAGAVEDVDGDGRQEIVVSLFESRWELKVYDAMTGREKLSAPDLYAHALVDLDGDGVAEIVAAEERLRTPREFTTLVVGGAAGGRWTERLRLARCRMEYRDPPDSPLNRTGQNLDPRIPILVELEGRRALVAALDGGDRGRADRLVLVSGTPGGPLAAEGFDLDPALETRVLAASKGGLVLSGADARLRAVSFDGRPLAAWSSGGVAATGVVAADLDGDGVHELVVCRPGRRVEALRFRGSGRPETVWSADGQGFSPPGCYADPPGPCPRIADVDGDGRPEVLVACGAPGGGMGVRLLDWRGWTRWTAVFPEAVETPLFEAIGRPVFGRFGGGAHPDVYVPVRAFRTGNNAQLSYALDGRSGEFLWRRDGTAEPLLWNRTLGPTGYPTVADVDGDGADDILLVSLDLCTALSGRDGRFLHPPLIANEIWKGLDGPKAQWTAYGTQIPADLDGDGRLEILLAASWGAWGAWTLDRRPLWTVDPGPDGFAMRLPGLADADGDGRLEIGVLHNGGVFRCYDAATGALRWELSGLRQSTDVVAADVDGDGRPEFLAGGARLAAFQAGERSGRVLWEVPVPGGARSPAVADVDGDGIGEVIVGCGDGRVRVYK